MLSLILGTSFILTIFATYISLGFSSNNPFMFWFSVPAGLLCWMGFVWAYNQNPERSSFNKVKEDPLWEKLEDDIAFMSALYYKVHPDYRTDVLKDISLLRELASKSFELDEEWIDQKYAEYYQMDLNWYARNAEAIYTDLTL